VCSCSNPTVFLFSCSSLAPPPLLHLSLSTYDASLPPFTRTRAQFYNFYIPTLLPTTYNPIILYTFPFLHYLLQDLGRVQKATHWLAVRKADWRAPHGPLGEASTGPGLEQHPVVQVLIRIPTRISLVPEPNSFGP
jgi:hypothetical protein